MSLSNLIGEKVFLAGPIYFYTGLLEKVGYDERSGQYYAELSEPEVVYNTGEHDTEEWWDAKPMPKTWYVVLPVESYGIWKQKTRVA